MPASVSNGWVTQIDQDYAEGWRWVRLRGQHVSKDEYSLFPLPLTSADLIFCSLNATTSLPRLFIPPAHVIYKNILSTPVQATSAAMTSRIVLNLRKYGWRELEARDGMVMSTSRSSHKKRPKHGGKAGEHES